MTDEHAGWHGDWVELYDFIDADRGPHLGFYVPLAEGAGSLLDLGCGTGIITLEVAARLRPGARVVGVDLSPVMLAAARARAPWVDWRLGDLTDPPVEGPFDLVMVCFHTLQMLTDPADFARTMRNVALHLTPRGRFAFDIYQPNYDWLAAQRPDPHFVRAFTGPGDEALQIWEIDSAWDPVARLHTGTWTLRDGQGIPLPMPPMPLVLRQYDPDEVQAMLADAGLRVVEVYGDLDRRPLTPATKRQVYVCGLA